MPERETQHDDKQLRQLAHDVQHCLHVIGIGTEFLKSVREDESRFIEICESIDKERRAAKKLVGALLDAVFEARENIVK